jgi:hypothetical protein
MAVSSIPLLSAYAGLPETEQLLHGLHFMLCSFAVLIACVPLGTPKGSFEHKLAGYIYLPLSFTALSLAGWMAWSESSFVLFCFNAFCLYLLLSGWRAVHEKEKPTAIDWAIPTGLIGIALAVAVHVAITDEGTRSLYLFGFALNGFYLAWRDMKHLQRRNAWHWQRMFLSETFMDASAAAWMNRHVAGMIGSVIANTSVVVLTLLPLELHWIWPTGLMIAGSWIWWKDRQKKMRVKHALAPILRPGFGRGKVPRDAETDDVRRAA